MRFLFTILNLVLFTSALFGQELFPNTEPASTLPKGVWGVRTLYETYLEQPSNRLKYWDALRLMYGATGKLTLMITASASNHHLQKFPKDLKGYFLNHHLIIYKKFPFLFEGINFYAKYRVYSMDGKQKHLRIALYGQATKSFIPHDEAEPDLQSDNSGVGGGVIVTQLYKRFAASITIGYIDPFTFKDKSQQITFRSGKCNNYDIALGYRLFPVKYNDYNNINVNFYVELLNRHYYSAYMTTDGAQYDFSPYQYLMPYNYNSLQENKYSEIRPSIQFIFNSNDRLDIGIAGPLYHKSYMHYYPMYFFHLQKYFFPDKKSKKKGNLRSIKK